ncbi:MAG: acyl CoA:acetate/3-ketoacid CoA transferase [Chloroflexi bacterium]|nr:acyl CoA:acetate/3-ketoacid CoA transferase [Chloroflexota bacterium]
MAPRVITAEEAAGLVKSGDTVTVGGIVGTMLPEKVLAALEARFLTEGAPRDLTWYDPSPTGAGPGYEHLSHEGMLKRVYESWFPPLPELIALIQQDKVEAYFIPLATGHLLLREIAAGSRGLLSRVGLHTMVDPRLGGGRLNNVTVEPLTEVVNVLGEERLLYPAFPIHVAIIRGSTADEAGNIALEEEPLTLGIFYQAMAAKRSGGTVIAQVKRLAQRGSLHPRQVVVPGMLVDYIVVDPQQKQNETFPDRYILSQDGAVRVPEPPAVVYPLTADKIAGRRAALELRPGMSLNVGAGIPGAALVPITREEDIQDLLTISVEHGCVAGAPGGVSGGGGWPLNPPFMLSYQELFDYYNGGGIDACFLAFGELDREGNVNLLRFGGAFIGPGGSMDISQGPKKVVFCATFTARGLQVRAGDGKLAIAQEGQSQRLVERVQDICFSGRDMHRRGKEVLYVTERAVFKLGPSGPVLVEVAPGIDVEREVLGQMGFRSAIAPDLKTMDQRLFRADGMALRRELIGESRDRPTVRGEPPGWAAVMREPPKPSS